MHETADRAVRVGLIQMSCGGDPSRNKGQAASLIREAAARGARIICLQELFSSLYFCQTEDHAHFTLAEEIPGPTTQYFADLARETESVLILPLFERRAPGIYHNSAAVLDADGSYLGKYRKMHIPDDPLYHEKFYFRVEWSLRPARALPRAPSHPGDPPRATPSGIGWHPGEKATYGAAQHDAWRTIQRSHAIANGIFVAAANRIGHEGDPRAGIEFWGSSFICDPGGEVIASASEGREEILTADCDLRRVDTTRTHWPFLRDRRLEAYGDLTRRYLD